MSRPKARPWCKLWTSILTDPKFYATRHDFCTMVGTFVVLLAWCTAEGWKEGVFEVPWKALSTRLGCTLATAKNRINSCIEAGLLVDLDDTEGGSDRSAISRKAKMAVRNRKMTVRLKIPNFAIYQSSPRTLKGDNGRFSSPSPSIDFGRRRATESQVGLWGGEEPLAEPGKPADRDSGSLFDASFTVNASMLPDGFPAWPITWYEERWEALFVACVDAGYTPWVKHIDGNEEWYSGPLMVVAWLSVKWGAICDYADGRARKRNTRPAYKQTATTWWNRLVDCVRHGQLEELQQRELTTAASRAVTLFGDAAHERAIARVRKRWKSARKENDG